MNNSLGDIMFIRDIMVNPALSGNFDLTAFAALQVGITSDKHCDTDHDTANNIDGVFIYKGSQVMSAYRVLLLR